MGAGPRRLVRPPPRGRARAAGDVAGRRGGVGPRRLPRQGAVPAAVHHDRLAAQPPQRDAGAARRLHRGQPVADQGQLRAQRGRGRRGRRIRRRPSRHGATRCWAATTPRSTPSATAPTPTAATPRRCSSTSFWWVNQEVLHHGAEIALLRDLYRRRATAERPLTAAAGQRLARRLTFGRFCGRGAAAAGARRFSRAYMSACLPSPGLRRSISNSVVALIRSLSLP